MNSAMIHAHGVQHESRFGINYHDSRWRVEKRSTTDGSRFWKKTVDITGEIEMAQDVAVDGTGIYIVGFDKCTELNSRWRMEKRNP